SLALDENGTPHVGYWVGGAPEGVEGGLYLAVLQPSSPGPGFPTTTAFAVALLCAGVAAIVLWRRGMRVRAEEP
ncbi:MAG: hypothetical protein JW880_00940, partial [Candidatus Thermoplasmatota archaeon]|nr:hypothetical protein [Candidatus Thermoplasmatota archaeon]